MAYDRDNFSQIFKEFLPFLDSWWPYVIGIIVSLLTVIRSYIVGPACPDNDRIDGKTVIITGASSGLGKRTALELAKRGGHIILAVRNVESSKAVAEKIEKKFGVKTEVKEIDLSSLKSIKNFVDHLDVDEVDILINNAGIVFHPYKKTEEGFENHFVTNYLGHYLLTHLLLPKLKAAKQGRIINITAHSYSMSSIDFDDLNCETNFSAGKAFAQSKLALILMARFMTHILKETNVTINAVDPGLVRGTKHMRHFPLSNIIFIKLVMLPWMWLLMKNPTQGIQTIIYAAVSRNLDDKSGKLLSDCEISNPTANAMDDDGAQKLYMKSMTLVKKFLEEEEIINSIDSLN